MPPLSLAPLNLARLRRAHLKLGLAAGLLVGLSASAAQAAEGGQSPYQKGYFDVYAGIVPPYPGWYVRNDTIYYSGDVGRTVLSGRVEAGIDLSSVANVTAASLVTEHKIFGGQYALAVIVPLAYADIDVHANAAGQGGGLKLSDNDFNVADLAVSPITLGWHNGNLHTNAGFTVYLPTGPYEKGRLANLSKNYVTLQSTVGMSWMDPKSAWDVSGALSYIMTTKNQATDYDTGDIVHLDTSVSKGFGAWRLGLVGYAMVQVTGDTGSGALLGADKAQVYGLGPLVSYGAKFGDRPVTLQAKWYHEWGAHNTTEGDTVAATFSLKF